MKVCSRCNTEKGFEDFNKKSNSRDGRRPECRDCQSQLSHAYNEKPEVKYRMREADRRFKEKHRESLRLKARQRYQGDSDRQRQRSLAYYYAQKESDPQFEEKIAQKNKSYRDRHPQKVRLRNELRRVRQAGCEGSYSLSEWAYLCELTGNICLACGESKALTVDHVVPIVLRGTNYIWNLQPLCLSCNCSKGIKIIDYRPISIRYALGLG